MSDSDPQCQLFGVLGIIIQALLGLLSFSTLILKRYKDPKRRSWATWGLDTSKQAIGACYLHCVNLLLGEMFGGHGGNQCKWYFLNYLMDIFIGTFLNYIFLLAIEKLCSHFEALKFESGVYESEKPIILQWFYQFMIWIAVLTLAKFAVIGVGVLGINGLNWIGEILLTPFKIDPNFELIMVMVVFPFIMNAGQFWVQDNFLKKREIPKGKEVEVTNYEGIREDLISKEEKCVKEEDSIDNIKVNDNVSIMTCDSFVNFS